MKKFDVKSLLEALKLLDNRLSKIKADAVELVVCGGSALIVTELVARTTKDLDVVACMNSDGQLIDADPLPNSLLIEAERVAENLNLPKDWINSGPADLFRMGLPEGFQSRLHIHKIGESLTIHFIGRLDQIYFKLYASVDRGGYHIDDLLALNPTENELVAAARWTFTHDVSEGFEMLLKNLLNHLGYKNAVTRI